MERSGMREWRSRILRRSSRATSALRARGPEQPEGGRACLLDLSDRAFPRLLRGPPAQNARAVAKPSAAEMIVADLDDELGLEWLPFGRAPRGPSARAARRLAGETRRLDQPLELLGQRLAFRRLDVRREADVMEQSLFVVEAEQQPADQLRAFLITEGD